MTDPKIVMVPVSDLKPADYNPRQMTKKQADDLEESVKRFGIVDPIIANSRKGRENTLVGGHQRLEIAKRLGIAEVPVIFVDLSEAKERELNLRLNKNLGGWDLDALANLERELLADVGFSDDELDRLLAGGPGVAADKEVKFRAVEDAAKKCPSCGYEF